MTCELYYQVHQLIRAENRNLDDLLSWRYLVHCQEQAAEAALTEILAEENLGGS